IKVLNVPKGYNKNQLIFTSNDSQIASVDKNGSVVANSKGNTIITIKTSDEIHEIKCHVLVR
ncbi:MAG: Ig-like domain-containing protein, partial [Bacillota bacterium]|nr:Ig-like domain-containing protein [Bacillota bacterium]